jgi:CRISPR-associated endonuclease/helicase Cas3
MIKTFRDFFRQATRTDSEPEGRMPYPYQERFADSDVLPHLIQAPTGAGKTATAVLGWLWRLLRGGIPTPRRLVYCLPMRVLVEQSVKEAKMWIENLDLDFAVNVLMGGVDADEWYLYPEKPAILIGTQDMLLSRALNRGYAASRFHWPIDFALLNNDCLWVFDEPQLMATGVPTSSQLAGLRASLETFGPCPSVWMSATLEPNWLDTVDFAGRFPGGLLELSAEDYDPARPLHMRMTAEKRLSPLGIAATNDGKDVAREVVKQHVSGTQTLVVVNTVKRAKAVYAAVNKDKTAPKDVLLVHSRFRPAEREILNDSLMQPGIDRIIIATQVVEAGVDISARTLVTELAPWASVVQRIGRCNRAGKDGPGRVFWIDIDVDKLAPPYEVTDLSFAREQLTKLEGGDVSPKALEDFKRGQSITLQLAHTHVLRRRDVLDLFDTMPDLSGNDIDIQRFVRGDDKDSDVQFFWREFPGDAPAASEPSPNRRELCNVPVGEGREFLKLLGEKKRRAGYVWDHLDGKWAKLNQSQVRPGLAILLASESGGYSGLGWDSDSTTAVAPVPVESPVREEAASSDPNSAISVALTILEHTEHVCGELRVLLNALPELPNGWIDPLVKAALMHDVGKALPVAQKAMHDTHAPDPTRLLAKSGRRGRLNYEKYGRKHFRHELGSALAVLQNTREWPFVVAYLIAAHHGRVRLTVRALPGEIPPDDESFRFALGVRDGDRLPEVDLGTGVVCAATTLDLTPMQLGGDRSWTARSLDLLAELGPFRLAYLEMLLRAADVRASKKEAKNA